MAAIIIQYGEQTIKLGDTPIRVGRSVNNELLINASGVAAHHLTLKRNGEAVEISAHQPTYAKQQRLASSSVISDNTLLQLGNTHLALWLDPSAPLNERTPSNWWTILTHPLSALIWFCLALAIPLWLGYLDTAQQYVLDLRLIFKFTITYLFIVWIMQSILLPVAKRYLLFPLGSLTAIASITSDITDQASYWFNFQLNQGWFDYLAFLITAGIFLSLLRCFLREFVPLAGRMLNIYTISVALPCLTALLLIFLQSQSFYEYRSGQYPSYHSGILPNKLERVQTQSIQAVLNIDKTNQ